MHAQNIFNVLHHDGWIVFLEFILVLFVLINFKLFQISIKFQ